MDILGAKILSMSVVGIVSIVAGLLPILLVRYCIKPQTDDPGNRKRKKSKWQLFLSGKVSLFPNFPVNLNLLSSKYCLYSYDLLWWRHHFNYFDDPYATRSKYPLS
jgi:hypothetical protein